jgi:hypothetical protein
VSTVRRANGQSDGVAARSGRSSAGTFARLAPRPRANNRNPPRQGVASEVGIRRQCSARAAAGLNEWAIHSAQGSDQCQTVEPTGWQTATNYGPPYRPSRTWATARTLEVLRPEIHVGLVKEVLFGPIPPPWGPVVVGDLDPIATCQYPMVLRSNSTVTRAKGSPLKINTRFMALWAP